jgi:hypothetical protein
LNIGGRKIGIGAIIALVAVCVIGASLFGGLGNLFGGGDRNSTSRQPGAAGGQLQSQMFVSDQVDNQGCPVGGASTFDNDRPIYAGLERTNIPRGTEIFARLYRDGRPVEDAPAITADREMNTCVWFEFSPSAGQSFEPGNYTAEIIVNGNRAGQVAFDVSGSGIANTGRVELGRLVTTTQVNSDGCPTDDVDTFFSDEPIYLSVEESFIPAGTELFARLNYQGSPVEDTDVIRAERDRESCVWFIFEPQRGFNQGNYTVELFVNGQRVDSLPLQVQ